jgi:mycothiol synthase
MQMRLRAPTADDDQAVLALLVARDIADFGAPDIVLEDLHDRWRASDLDLARDALVVEDGRQIVGYALVHGPGAWVAVHPEHEGRGIGTRLLAWVEQRGREQGRSTHRQWTARTNAPGRELLLAAGYSYERTYSRMSRSLAPGIEPPPPIASLTTRALNVEAHAAPLHALDVAAFSANPDYEPETPDGFSEEHLQAHDLDPDLSVVAEREGSPIAFLLAKRWVDESTGFVDILGVHPDHQRRGIGRHLLLHAFAGFAAAGLRNAELGVASDNPRALALYERVGMTARFQVDTFSRPVER